jgi:hypothetical protein
MNHLRFKEATYVTKYYDSKEHQFVYTFIRFLFNLEARSTRRIESSDCIIKNVIDRYTLI